MSHLLAASRLSLSELARREGVSIPTTWRWAQRGVRGVKIETFAIGGRRYTTTEAFQRFVEATTAAAQGVTPAARTNRQREAAIAKAEAELDMLGV